MKVECPNCKHNFEIKMKKKDLEESNKKLYDKVILFFAVLLHILTYVVADHVMYYMDNLIYHYNQIFFVMFVVGIVLPLGFALKKVDSAKIFKLILLLFFIVDVSYNFYESYGSLQKIVGLSVIWFMFSNFLNMLMLFCIPYGIAYYLIYRREKATRLNKSND